MSLLLALPLMFAPWDAYVPPPRLGSYVGGSLAVGASVTDESIRYGSAGYVTKGRIDAEAGLGLLPRLTLGLAVHYTPHFSSGVPSAQGFEVPLTGWVWNGLYARVAPGVDWVPAHPDELGDGEGSRYVVAPGGVISGGWEWLVGKRLGISFDVGVDVRAVPSEGALLLGGFNRVRFTFYD